MIELCGDMVVPQFGEYKYIHEVGSKPEVILYWIRYFTAILKKEICILGKSSMLNGDNLLKIDVVIGGDHGQGTFRFPYSKNIECESSVTYTLCKKDNGEIIQYTIIKTILIDHHQVSIDNVYVAGDLAF